MDLSNVEKIHCVGIKGIGLSALAQILKAQGYRVTGSDVSETFPADKALHRAGIRIKKGFKAKHVAASADLVVASNAYIPKEGKRNSSNIEVRTARRSGIPVRPYPKVVAELFNRECGIAVAGSHGKSTTTALLASTLAGLGYDPYAIIGAVAKEWKSNARVPQREKKYKKHEACGEDSRFFVLEADEYRHAFLHYRPFGAVVTTIDWDHPDVFSSASVYRMAFQKFVRKIAEDGFLVACGDDKGVRHVLPLASAGSIVHYGFEKDNKLRIAGYRYGRKYMYVALTYKRRSIGEFRVSIFGKHNALNVAAVVGVCLSLQEKPGSIRQAMRKFQGTARRFEALGEARIPLKDSRTGAPLVFDDYAHHPSEIRAVLKTVREVFPKKRIVVLFQPHTFSRTEALFGDFVAALKKADEVIILATYGSAREGEKGSKDPAEKLAKKLGVPFAATHKTAYKQLKKVLRPGDIFFTLGAGDVNRVGKRLAG